MKKVSLSLFLLLFSSIFHFSLLSSLFSFLSSHSSPIFSLDPESPRRRGTITTAHGPMDPLPTALRHHLTKRILTKRILVILIVLILCASHPALITSPR